MFGSTRFILTLALAPALAVVMGLGGCDDSSEQRKDLPADSKSLRKFKTPAEAIGAYNRCYSDCFTAETSQTNRETCKLDCDMLVETGMDLLPDEPSKARYKQTWTTLRGCITSCWDDKKLNETNRATCLLTCSDAAEMTAVPEPSANPTPPVSPPPTPPSAPPTAPPAAPPTGTTPPAAPAPTAAPPTAPAPPAAPAPSPGG